ncbi:uracil-DNA glycosylase family protein [Lichenihabitans sp. Uapishka_5]|uniref:uracil-DNA glycosylase family protein n=1 Tax=Lichenihabitans sp. Uapishka_5 TaxID=3037302 RepID=UPI0029E80125|nr:uracil-DNA glycosylase family protein [Lichenihabitans sp. Uapishka_5]MDX7952307.1 uracil-DNA glycosylase family protein [Lichenihabitans sp. Uapishka_5]
MFDEEAPTGLEAIVAAAARCRLCRDQPLKAPLPHEPRPIFRISAEAPVVIASQAPGHRAHVSGVPFDDPSGVRLRDWMGLTPARFYDASRVAIVPMGFCFPGHDAQKGDLPPRPECRLAWHDRIFAALPRVELILVIGLYAMRYHLPRLGVPVPATAGMTDLVAGWRRFADTRPRLIPLPHPSWRNSAWLARNPWFAEELLPTLRSEVARLTA